MSDHLQPDSELTPTRQNLCRKNLLALFCLALMGAIFLSNAKAQPIDSPPYVDNQLDGDNLTSSGFYFEGTTATTPAVQLQSSVRMSIAGMLASVVIEQHFENSSNDWQEGIYVFPLPTNAAVKSLDIRIGDRIIKGKIAERESAQQQYEDARAAGQVSGLVEQQRPNLFTTRIANIAPLSEISIILRYTQTIQWVDEHYSVRVPSTLTPRYSNSLVADAAAISPPQRYPSDSFAPGFTLTAELFGTSSPESIYSSTHDIDIEPEHDRLRVSFASPMLMNRDFELAWRVPTGESPVVSTWVEQLDGERYLLAMIPTPEPPAARSTTPRELIIIIDTSGSMAGQSIRAAREALKTAINDLAASDHFNIIEFNSATRSLFRRSEPATSENLAKARRFVRRLQADGGTEMVPALTQALRAPVADSLKQIVLITDGAVGYEDNLFTRIEEQIDNARLFTVGIGSAPNSYFMTKASELGRGSFTYIADLHEAEEKMTRLFDRLRSPLLTDLSIDWQGATPDFTPSPLPDLYPGEPLALTAKLGSDTSAYTVTGNYLGNPWSSEVDLQEAQSSNSGINRLWARNKIDSLLDLQRRSGIDEQFKDAITRLALTHEIVSPYTSLVATEESVSRGTHDPLYQQKVASLMPAGSTMTAIGIPAGNNATDSLLLVGLLLLMAAAVTQAFSYHCRNPA